MDEIILTDESADPIERSSSAKKLLSDGYGKQVVPVLAQWLDHQDALLREDAVSLLLASLGQEKYLNKAIELLHNDSDDTVRGDAARGIAIFCAKFIEGEKYQDEVIKELLLSLIRDKDTFVRQNSYKGLLQVIEKRDWNYYDEKDSFNPISDVDWEFLEPFLNKYSLKKPS